MAAHELHLKRREFKVHDLGAVEPANPAGPHKVEIRCDSVSMDGTYSEEKVIVEMAL